MLVVYAVVDLDCCCHEQPVESDCETPLMYALTCTLEDEIGKIRGYKRTRKVNVVVVGGVDKKDALRVSVILERTLSTLNIMASDNKTYTKYVLMNKNRRGKAIRPKQGQKMATDEPPEDVAGVPVFLTQRPCIASLFKNKHSWWGSTVGLFRRNGGIYYKRRCFLRYVPGDAQAGRGRPRN
ncbi:hypothetical protein Pcinc_020665 [Petrolisthes cinctipes]|uniref:Uncharacterized protein n=1 Tax=Petrolisthes cinctipes TaxID=88211 RepID=A0AAE1FIY9_PETCI|nr:hypothetical protein Pcinc_020665 [Petrolisthes cinctipes]